jgi:transposase
MADGGMSVETIAKFVDFDVETVKQWLAQRGKA